MATLIAPIDCNRAQKPLTEYERKLKHALQDQAATGISHNS